MENNNALCVFNYNGYQLRTVQINGYVWFVAKDVCDIPDIHNNRDSIAKVPDEDAPFFEKLFWNLVKLEDNIIKHFKPFFTFRSNRAQFRHFRLTKFNLKGGD